jgi:chromosome segregation ATPase
MATAPPISSPAVRLELRHGSSRPVTYDVGGDEFLVGTVPGCDLRLAGGNLPPILCVIARSAEGPRLRKLAPALPLMLNGRPVQTANLRAGDTISLGPLSLIVHTEAAAPPVISFIPIDPPAGGTQTADVAELRRKVDEQAAELEADRVLWYRRRDDLEKECRERERAAEETHRAIEAEQRRREDLFNDATAALDARLAECEKREQFLAERDAKGQSERDRIDQRWLELGQREQELTARAAELQQLTDSLGVRQQDVEKLRDELSAEKRDWHHLYQERRDRIAGLHQAVQTAASKVQIAKRELTEREQALAPRLEELDARSADLIRREQDLAAARGELEQARQQLADHEAEVTARLQAAGEDIDRRHAECANREASLAAQEERHRADLVRLDRFQDTVDQRERQVAAAEAEVEQKREQLRRDTLELEEQARQVDDALAAQRAEDERLKQVRLEAESATARLTERASQVEGQQAMLAALRTKLERMRDEVRQEATFLAEQRVRQEAAERDLQEKARALEELRSRVESDSLAHAAERQIFEGRHSELETTSVRVRELQEKLSADDAEMARRRERLDAEMAEQETLAAELKGRAAQLLELQEKLTADRHAVKEREAVLAREEETRKSLQEQLRRRAEELTARQKQIEEQSRDFETRAGQMGAEYQAAAQQKQAAEAAIAAARQGLDQQMAEMRRSADRLAASEANLLRLSDRLKTSGRALAAGRKAHAAEKSRWAIDHQTAEAEAKRTRAEFDTLRRQLPDLEMRGQAVLVRLGQAREELRGHLGGLHDYARQAQEDLESLQNRVRAEAERLRDQEAAVNRARAEHRLAVTEFRQQLLEWQGRVADMRRVLADDGTRLERKEAEVTAAAKQVDETAQQLARQAADLQAQERQVVERRSEMERHLHDMREWYRNKLRELAESRNGVVRSWEGEVVKFQTPPATAGGPDSNPTTRPPHQANTEAEPNILSLTDDLDPGDRQLGDLLRSLELVDNDTLMTLLLEARRQRRSLRQVLLSAKGGTPLLTLYQLALIESGNLDALVLGPTRVIDRLQATQRETVYRVFDPRRAAEGQGTVLLRHLAEAEMHDAVHPDEFRQRFAALSALPHPNLAATQEVLEINGRPAVLQEWLSGLPATDWPSITVPAVWHWLVSQTAAGLHAAHQAGLVHGRLSPRSIVLTPAGIVKLTGCGEPPWLTGGPTDATPADDLTALGEIAAGWAAATPKRKGAKSPKALPDSLQRVLERLRPEAADRYSSAADVLADLEQAGPELPPVGDAWRELLAFTTENATDGVAWRKSA